ncbi:MAG TPA: hypothetical protein VG326_13750 [Tepidisphaeraceae bacterium]|jgi:hypothetical protein|nr:hypothetical protein [Tepidisphaeraceae bacterium]
MASERHLQIRRFAPGPAVMPHRKNVAEWMMWFVVAPAVWLARLIAAVLRSRKSTTSVRQDNRFQHEG